MCRIYLSDFCSENLLYNEYNELMEEFMCLSDINLIEKALDGDISSFGELVQKYERMISIFVFSILGDREEAKDISQEVFLRAFQSLSSLIDRGKFKGWLFGISRRICLEYLRKKKLALFAPEELAKKSYYCADVEDTLEIIEKQELNEFVMKELYSLPLKYREVIILRHFQDASYKEIAQTLGLTSSGVDTRLQRARMMLSEKLKNIVSDIYLEK